jgi:hypothetical protein
LPASEDGMDQVLAPLQLQDFHRLRQRIH